MRFITPLLLACLSTTGAFAQTDDEAVQILDQIDNLFLSETSYAKVRLYVSRPDFKWSYNLEMYTRGRNNTFIRIHSPLDYKGRGILKVGKEMWFFDPKDERVRQISRTGALRRFLQSEFSRDDFLKINRLYPQPPPLMPPC